MAQSPVMAMNDALRPKALTLPAAGSPLGSITVDGSKCTLCSPPYACIRCAKPFGSLKAIEIMLGRLRDDLVALGLARSQNMSETEDNAACVFEVMRYLIAGDDVTVSKLTQPMAFFNQHLQPWVSPMCQFIQAHPRAVFYARLADFTAPFMGVQAQEFNLVN
jgi:TorA maturation chaperone TorD